MLTSTFVHARGVGERTETSLWHQGALSWDLFLREPERWDVSPVRRTSLEIELDRSLRALDDGTFQYFARVLSPPDRWRAFEEFKDGVGYLDIETDGGYSAESVTVVGLYSFGKFEAFVKGENLGSFPDALERCSMIVTFFGTGFDIPMLKKAFPQLPFDQLHVDLCPTLRRLGLSGGLKKIEERLGIRRSPETTGLSGMDAVYMWRRWLRGDDGALETLIQYNREDTVNMELLMLFAFARLEERCRARMECAPVGRSQWKDPGASARAVLHGGRGPSLRP